MFLTTFKQHGFPPRVNLEGRDLRLLKPSSSLTLHLHGAT